MTFDFEVCCIGAGYVGGPSMTVFAKKIPNVKFNVVDIDERRISAWNSDKLPVYEPGLDDLVKETRGKNLFFSTDVAGGIKAAKIIFVAVNTPSKNFGLHAGKAYDLSAWESVARSIATNSTSDKIIVEKSTVPVHTAHKFRVLLQNNDKVHFEVLSNPEFLAEGTAINDLYNPDRILVGSLETETGKAAAEELCKLYRLWVPSEKIITTNLWSAELAKLSANAFLAQRVSSINALSAVCEATGADIEEIAKALGTDSRIGKNFLKSSVGFGGSCFKKDINGLVYLCESHSLSEEAEYWRWVIKMNEHQKTRFAQKIYSSMFGNLRNKKIFLLGFAFKKNTGDIRESPAIDVAHFLLCEGAKLVVYDPKVEERTIHELGSPFTEIKRVNDPLEAANGADAIVVLTEWDEFKTYDYKKLYDLMRKPAYFFDGRNIIDAEKLVELGFIVHAIGRKLNSDNPWVY